MTIKSGLSSIVVSALVISGCSMLDDKIGDRAPDAKVFAGFGVLNADTHSDLTTASVLQVAAHKSNQDPVQIAEISTEQSTQLIKSAEHVSQAVLIKPAKHNAVSAPIQTQEVQIISDTGTQKYSQVVSAVLKQHVEASSGWYIQMAAFPKISSAESMRTELSERQESVTIQSVQVKGIEYQRVLVGPYPTK